MEINRVIKFPPLPKLTIVIENGCENIFCGKVFVRMDLALCVSARYACHKANNAAAFLSPWAVNYASTAGCLQIMVIKNNFYFFFHFAFF